MSNALAVWTVATVIAYYVILRLQILKLENRIESMDIFIKALKNCLTKHEEEDNNGSQE